MFRSLFSVLIVASLLFGTVGVVEVSAADECRCFCTSSQGAVDTQKMLELNDCRSECEATNGRLAAWACTANEYPSRSVNCFTPDQCSEHGGDLDANYQPPECPNGMHYCYADPANQEAVDLAVSVGGLTSTKDLGEYLSRGYSWLVGAMTTIAIVLLMIAGLRYAFGAVSANAVSAAKQRILTIVIGLTLLLSTVLILATINPQLLRLSVPEFPMIKTISLVDNASCDELLALGYTIDYSGPEECGTTGVVELDGDGNPVSDGTVCNFSKCGGSDQLCVPGDTPTCMTCSELTPDNGVVQVSASVCSGFNSLPYYTDHNKTTTQTDCFDVTVGPDAGTCRPFEYEQQKSARQCFFSRDPDGGGEIVGRGACVYMSYSCSPSIKTCNDYDNINIEYGGGWSSLDQFDLGANSGLSGGGATETIMSELGEVTLGSVCSADICAWARTDGEQGCFVQSSSLGAITAGSPADILSATSALTYSCNTTPDTSSWWYTIFD